MALNDRDMALNKAVDVHPGIANPTTSSVHADPLAANFADDPTTEETGAGADSNFRGFENAKKTFNETAGVIEGRPGIIESTNLDPLKESSNADDGWANATKAPSTGSNTGSAGAGIAGTATSYATSATETAKAALQAGKEAVFGKPNSS